jgi:hypothetical protein
MAEIDLYGMAEILLQCRWGIGRSREVEAGCLEEEIRRLKEERFSGALCISSGEKGKSIHNWIVLYEGDIRLVFSLEAGPVFSEEDLRLIRRAGAARVFDFDEYQVKRLKSALGEMPRPTSTSTPPPERLEREELLRKYRLKEPAEEYIDAILRGYREPTPEERRRCEEMILTIKRDLSEMFGEKMAEKMFDRQFRSLGIDKYNMTAKDIGTLLDSLQRTVLRGLLGPRRAEEAVRRLKRRAFKTIQKV